MKKPLPKAIDDCRLIETIIEIRIVPATEVGGAMLAGMLMPRLQEAGYLFRRVPQVNMMPEGNESVRLTIENESGVPAGFFENEDERVRLLVDGTTIAFNCVNGPYIGWERYSAQIARVLDILEQEGVVAGYERTMIRYINEYDDDLLENVDIEVNPHGGGDNMYDTLEVRLSRNIGNVVVYVSISGKRKRQSTVTGEKRETSLLDVNVFDRLADGSGLADVKESLERIHLIEKESFFGLLKEDYLKSLNPIY